MNNKLTILFMLFVATFLNPLMSQEDKTITLVVSGQGKNQEDAKLAALRNGIEQAFGTFISSNTLILNDKLIKDEIVSLSNGNIQKFDILNSTNLPDGSAVVTLKAVISVSKLINFSESKGVTIEFKGGLFTLNIKQQILNEQAEVKSIWDMLFMLNPIAYQSIDYTISSKDPKSRDKENRNWVVPIEVKAITNKNFEFIFTYLKQNLSLIALTNEEIINYQSLNKMTYSFVLDSITYNFRKEESFKALNIFFKDFNLFCSNFYVDDGVKKKKCKDIEKDNFPWDESSQFTKNDFLTSVNYDEHQNNIKAKEQRKINNINISYYKSIPSNTIVGEYKFLDKKTLSEIEILNGYKIYPAYPKDKIGTWYAGGIIFYEDSLGNGLVCSLFPYKSRLKYNNEIGKGMWGCAETYIQNTESKLGSGQKNTMLILENCKEEWIAAQICKQSTQSGYNDWFLPSIDELVLAYNALNLQGSYWSSTQKEKIYDRDIKYAKGVSGNEIIDYHKEYGYEGGTPYMPWVLPIRAY